MNAHPYGKFRVLPERFGNLERAPGWFLRAVAEDQRHPVAGRQPDELFLRGLAHLRGGQHDLSELVKPLLLFLDQELRVTNNVDEEDMPNFKAEIFVDFRHRPCLPEMIINGDVFPRLRIGRSIGMAKSKMPRSRK